MVTQELLGYIRAELAKGKSREEIHGVLLAGGGWNEDDLSEAFRVIIPMQSIILPKEKPVQTTPPFSLSPASPSPLSSPAPAPSPSVSFSPSPLRSFSPPSSYSPSPSLIKPIPPPKPLARSFSSFLKFLIILIIVGGLGFGFWYYRPQMMSLPSRAASLWNSLTNSVSNFSFFSFGTTPNTSPSANMPAPIPASAPAPVAVIPAVIPAKDCGTAVAPKLGAPVLPESDSVLSCLGVSALNCENAKGILKDDFFPTIFEITKMQNFCSFKLSYGADSALTDVAGKKLAGQYVSCPLDIVKAIDNTKPATPKFGVPDKTNFSKYASQIYFYGTLGLFVENNLDQNKIQALGCSGEYVQSVIASYALKNKK